ncbi:hypothetical protein ABVT39_015638 [Epinephelus coioides]
MAKKPETTLSASLQPGSRSTGEAEEHLPRPSTSKERRELQPLSEESEPPALPPIASEPGSLGAESPSSHSQQQRGLPEDLGVDKPVQVRLKQFPKKKQHNNDCKWSFSANCNVVIDHMLLDMLDQRRLICGV